jgi:outer membrane protein OmpA-like peptidoglycan-associated protein
MEGTKQNISKPASPVQSLGARPSFFQPKLSINQPNDVYEQEADHMADRVMRMTDPALNLNNFFKPTNIIQRKCQHCEEEEKHVHRKENSTSTIQCKCKACEEKEKQVHRKESGGSEVQGSSELDSYVSSLSSSGHGLSQGSRSFFEPRFGQDFSSVRIHADSVAAKSAQSINALAYTTGNNIVFNSGQYSPESSSGKQLMAHELTHVVQQTGGKSQVQRQAAGAAGAIKEHGDITQVPAEVAAGCNIAQTSPADEQRINYATSSFSLNDTTKATLDDFVRRWTADGTNKDVRIDGYASISGTEELNWRLSCSRANSVMQELMHPSNGIPGIPSRYLSLYAHGATNRFSQAQLLPNQTATLTSEIRIIPPPVIPPPPAHVDPPVTPTPPAAGERKCGPDITAALGRVISSVDPYFRGLTWFQKRRSCMALDMDAPLAGVNPIMAWDTRDLFLPNTGALLDPYFLRRGCGSPRDPGCPTDPTRNLCEDASGCGNTVEVGGKCMLAGTANYGIYGRMFKLCNDEFSPDFPRWDMRGMIGLYKTVSFDDSTPPKEMATSVFDGTYPAVPAAVENRGSCTARCGVSHGGIFDFVWEPYRSR